MAGNDSFHAVSFRHVLKVLLWGVFFFTAGFCHAQTPSIDFKLDSSVLSEIFESPLNWDPVPEEVILNGKPEFRVKFKTRVPFPELKAYYISLLSQNQWIYYPAREMIPVFSGLTNQQLVFMKKTLLLMIEYMPGEKDNYLLVNLVEGFPLMLPDRDKIKPFLIEGIPFPNCEPLLQYYSIKRIQGEEMAINTFKTNASPDFMILYFDKEIMKCGWQRTPALEMIRGELFKMPMFEQKDILQKLQIYKKGDTFLFFFASFSPETSGTLFGYFYKSFLSPVLSSAGLSYDAP